MKIDVTLHVTSTDGELYDEVDATLELDVNSWNDRINDDIGGGGIGFEIESIELPDEYKNDPRAIAWVADSANYDWLCEKVYDKLRG
jgi:hypothetical protein